MHKPLTMTWAVLNDPIQGPRLAAAWITGKQPEPDRRECAVRMSLLTPQVRVKPPAPLDFGTYARLDADEPIAG